MAWHPNLASSLAFWKERQTDERVKFNAFLTIDLFDNIGKGEDAEDILAKIAVKVERLKKSNYIFYAIPERLK
jgi:hypothetical protein